MSKTAFIFPGQGAQKAGMGKDFYEQSKTAREVIDRASAVLDIDMKALCFEENEKLHQTEYTQAALVTICMAMEKVLEERGVKPDVTAGLSLGEYCAVASAGGMSTEDAIVTVRKRGTVANYNCPGQIVITGWKEKIEQAAQALKEAGAKRVLTLHVSGPFHSPMLNKAGEELGRVLEGIECRPLKIPYVTNVTAEYITDSFEIKSLLSRQVASPVRWQQSMERMLENGVDTFIEIGPGRTLAGFMKKISHDVKMLNVGCWDDVEKVVQEIC